MTTIRYEVAEGVATVTLNRPDRFNAFTPEMGAAYNEALGRADRDPDVRAVVVTGAGRGFCGGADLAFLAEVDEGTAQDVPEGIRPRLAMEIRKPVVAAVNGSAAGVGFALILFADVRFVAAEAKLTTTFSRLGLAAEYGSAWLLPRLVGLGNAADVLLSGRALTGEEAYRIGLAQRVLPAADVLPAALEYAREIAAYCAPRALETIKGQLRADLERPLDAALDAAAALMHASFGSPDLPEAMAARAEKRPPRFQPLGD
ncbi:enoyl-CoA hydratase-related protein [Phytohabitans sp. ZYX-F-186]|uniref:Enoyl-CoA hydratase-related protein n=1 Tax=Phytohabitans maris TaxID=3071409 RepID=A0ABU0ZBN0_9ACTN|nr:enoyl-CoA hydratase-related protein [Phytohabitans sp. ZYX-F-186]MDQ7903740.1 enoyl-CoA hydratase-related protein [Phytohabitans sp. ZYX-F-186]